MRKAQLFIFHPESFGILILIAAYSYGVFRESLWSDDYTTLINKDAMADLQMSDGRILAALIIPQSFALIGEPNNTWVLRFIALIGLIVLYLQTTKQIKLEKNQRLTLTLIAVGFCTPGFQMYTHWATTWSYLWVSVAGVFGFNFWRRETPISKLIGVIFLASALLIYPPAALFFFALIVVSNIINLNPVMRIIKELVSGVKYLFVSGSIAAVVVVLTLNFLGVQKTERLRLVHLSEVIEKLFWFLTRPIVAGLRPFLIDSPEPIFVALTTLPTFTILLFGIKQQSRKLKESFALRFVTFVVACCMPMIPILISPENQIEFRLIFSYGWIIATLAIYFVAIQVKQVLLETGRTTANLRSFAVSLLGVIVFFAILNVNQRYSNLFGNSYQEKNRFLTESIKECQANRPIETIRLLAPVDDFPLKKNIGVYSMETDLYGPWVSIPNLQLRLIEMKIEASVIYFDKRNETVENRMIKTGVCVVDLEKFRQEFITIEKN